MQKPRSLMRTEHRKHDRLLVTRFATDDAYPSERDEARLLIDSCPDCAALATDIRRISNAVGQVPVPARTRDFMISAEKAEELRGNRLTRWMRSFATPRWGTLRPMAGVALSIGLVMAVVGTALPSTVPAVENEGAPITLQATDNFAPPPAALESLVPEVQAPAAGVDEPPPELDNSDSGASQDPITEEFNAAYSSPQPVVGGDGERLAATESPATSGTLLVWIGLLIAAISLGMLALAFVARRFFADPLLR